MYNRIYIHPWAPLCAATFTYPAARISSLGVDSKESPELHKPHNIAELSNSCKTQVIFELKPIYGTNSQMLKSP